jgi:hypothetical protein
MAERARVAGHVRDTDSRYLRTVILGQLFFFLIYITEPSITEQNPYAGGGEPISTPPKIII